MGRLGFRQSAERICRAEVPRLRDEGAWAVNEDGSQLRKPSRVRRSYNVRVYLTAKDHIALGEEQPQRALSQRIGTNWRNDFGPIT